MSRLTTVNLGKWRLQRLQAAQRDWTKRKTEIIVPDSFDEAEEIKNLERSHGEINYFDGSQAEKVQFLASGNEGTISQMTLRQVSTCYGFSEHYLGDFVCSIGGDSPVDVNVKLGDILNGDQLYEILRALHSLDAGEVNEGYEGESIEDLASKLDVPLKTIESVCQENNIILPYGKDSVLHSTLYDQINRFLEEISNNQN